MSDSRPFRDDPRVNPNSLHHFHTAVRGPKGVPAKVTAVRNSERVARDPGHAYARTDYISFEFYNQRQTNAAFGYEHFVSLPRLYEQEQSRKWPLILFLHGSGESQRLSGESYASIRHGIPKVILCYDKLKQDLVQDPPSINIPAPPRN